ncbi:hypothetical protein OG21DRAFT_1501810 [Imleria badia]|nr:hypothetical protein OG21DRAFT_1501810 [Imleria badia]
MATASASIAGVMAYLDIRDATEFATRMRTWVSQSMPLLTAEIYRRPTSQDSVLDVPVLIAAQHRSSTLMTTFDHDAAEQRLADACDRGGFGAWAEAAAWELEAETEVENTRRASANHRPPVDRTSIWAVFDILYLMRECEDVLDTPVAIESSNAAINTNDPEFVLIPGEDLHDEGEYLGGVANGLGLQREHLSALDAHRVASQTLCNEFSIFPPSHAPPCL